MFATTFWKALWKIFSKNILENYMQNFRKYFQSKDAMIHGYVKTAIINSK